MLDFFRGTVTRRDWAFVAVVLCLAVLLCVGYYFGVHQPKQQTLSDLNAELQDTQSQLQKALETKANIEALRREHAKMEELVQSFEERLPAKREIPGLLSRFESLGSDLGLRLTLSPLPTTSDGQKETIPYKVTARGTFHQIVSFINLLERDERYFKISDIDIGEQEAGVSEATFTLSTFRFIQSEPTEDEA